MSIISQIKGRHAERQALKYLQRHGLKLLEQNFSGSAGEIDLIMRDENTLVFVEVRSKSTNRSGTPEETIDRTKQRRISQCANEYCHKHAIEDQQLCRFDVVAITGGEICWIKDAFMAIS